MSTTSGPALCAGKRNKATQTAGTAGKSRVTRLDTRRKEAPHPCGQHTKECTGARMLGLSQPLHCKCTWGGQHISVT